MSEAENMSCSGKICGVIVACSGLEVTSHGYLMREFQSKMLGNSICTIDGFLSHLAKRSKLRKRKTKLESRLKEYYRDRPEIKSNASTLQKQVRNKTKNTFSDK